jgi:hypothetical protein
MKVDLEALRTLIEKEIERVEQKKVRLKQQLQHIAAVEEIASQAESGFRVVEKPGKSALGEEELSEQSRRWFQQV